MSGKKRRGSALDDPADLKRLMRRKEQQADKLYQKALTTTVASSRDIPKDSKEDLLVRAIFEHDRVGVYFLELAKTQYCRAAIKKLCTIVDPITLLHLAVHHDPTLVEAHFLLARHYFARGEIVFELLDKKIIKVADVCVQAIDKDIESESACFMLGSLLGVGETVYTMRWGTMNRMDLLKQGIEMSKRLQSLFLLPFEQHDLVKKT